ncbi:UDP-N-acetylglucosamine--N-acetylmuramyl-(pentapeptide) pyrophosphoryl-undecaprenol N-acetylglucosamine transferase [Bifidobacterium sp. SMB2]|uniref:UDP-N-acetylglucosamine--N-acetylmuramyl-(pentapeptide) pyrophosphoryl-undecaprenol N-acetylglucosamine transferase n=1 Tax=Bifidobacterium saimiriisciurei TaxID=2661627 RepID=A0ABX0CDA1_9BIFI|nr:MULTISPECIES: UDP-N-acetylglucosamine--N-acetylmuramyl-(pentapeptide) pyrophosphoryl-undecaprenol N-acetylglucosamine transferase [Bifidobacterium]NEG95968.1 UDP-N-acetylglucosamine--N-acetylmuramyl-(pentapeptide) pyrophosphoryl-undecaprenol N-acetylglucosamine transferase [Bifidobacterium sp. SMB2]NEH11815.1 UDP-N-acetylglucosamine--N-acetylmuramyl-(pentapeptide) pyrophosphoryl-undecaprenol N-acetylglucosamine transferase [Bifidobacterium saimiriisciurei]
MSEGVSIVLAGGGTAGHVNPLLSIASSIRELDPSASISVIGTKVGLEQRLVPAAGFEMDTIEKVPFPRSINADAFQFPFRWVSETSKVKRILRERHADVLVGVGGYASAPAYYAAHAMGIPVVIHEQNARAGMANKLGSRWADFIGTVYEDTGLTAGPHATIERVGLPLRPAIAEVAAKMEQDRAAARREGAEALGVDPDRPIVLITGGSLGAQSLNVAVSNAARELLDVAQVIHLTGKGKLGQVRQLVSASAGEQVISGVGPDSLGDGDYHAAEYLERIDRAFACADLVMCRSGAGTVAEIAALGLPAVYVPLPIGNGEQKYNAEPVVEAGGGFLVKDDDFTSEWVVSHVPGLLGDKDRLASIAHAAWGYGIRDAADTMAKRVLALARR